jgi:acyl carrier protein
MKNKHEIISKIKNILLDRLELADTGLTADQITDTHLLLDETGLGLDSVEALDLLVGCEKVFSLKIGEINKDFIENTCHSIETLTNYIEKSMIPSVALVN